MGSHVGFLFTVCRPDSCVSFSYVLPGCCFFSLSFSPKPGINILGVTGWGVKEEEPDRSWPLPKQLCYVHGTLKTHSAQSGCRGNPAEPMIRGKWSHFLTSCFIQVEKVLTSSRVLCWPQLTEPRQLASPFDLSQSCSPENHCLLGLQGKLSSLPGVLSAPSFPASSLLPGSGTSVGFVHWGSHIDTIGNEAHTPWWSASSLPGGVCMFPQMSTHSLGPLSLSRRAVQQAPMLPLLPVSRIIAFLPTGSVSKVSLHNVAGSSLTGINGQMSLESAQLIPVLETQGTQAGVIFKIFNNQYRTDTDQSDPMLTYSLAGHQPLMGRHQRPRPKKH